MQGLADPAPEDGSESDEVLAKLRMGRLSHALSGAQHNTDLRSSISSRTAAWRCTRWESTTKRIRSGSADWNWKRHRSWSKLSRWCRQVSNLRNVSEAWLASGLIWDACSRCAATNDSHPNEPEEGIGNITCRWQPQAVLHNAAARRHAINNGGHPPLLRLPILQYYKGGEGLGSSIFYKYQRYHILISPCCYHSSAPIRTCQHFCWPKLPQNGISSTSFGN